MGVSQSPRAQLFGVQRSPKLLPEWGHSGWFVGLGFRDLGALAEERVSVGYSCLGSWWWVSWCPGRGWVKVVGGEDSLLSLGRSPGSGPVLEHPLSKWPREEGSGMGRRHFRPSSLIPVPSTLPHLIKLSFSISHFTLITYSLCAQRAKGLSDHSQL